jgi:hypothetical protein
MGGWIESFFHNPGEAINSAVNDVGNTINNAWKAVQHNPIGAITSAVAIAYGIPPAWAGALGGAANAASNGQDILKGAFTGGAMGYMGSMAGAASGSLGPIAQAAATGAVSAATGAILTGQDVMTAVKAGLVLGTVSGGVAQLMTPAEAIAQIPKDKLAEIYAKGQDPLGDLIQQQGWTDSDSARAAASQAFSKNMATTVTQLRDSIPDYVLKDAQAAVKANPNTDVGKYVADKLGWNYNTVTGSAISNEYGNYVNANKPAVAPVSTAKPTTVNEPTTPTTGNTFVAPVEPTLPEGVTKLPNGTYVNNEGLKVDPTSGNLVNPSLPRVTLPDGTTGLYNPRTGTVYDIDGSINTDYVQNTKGQFVETNPKVTPPTTTTTPPTTTPTAPVAPTNTVTETPITPTNVDVATTPIQPVQPWNMPNQVNVPDFEANQTYNPNNVTPPPGEHLASVQEMLEMQQHGLHATQLAPGLKAWVVPDNTNSISLGDGKYLNLADNSIVDVNGKTILPPINPGEGTQVAAANTGTVTDTNTTNVTGINLRNPDINPTPGNNFGPGGMVWDDDLGHWRDWQEGDATQRMSGMYYDTVDKIWKMAPTDNTSTSTQTSAPNAPVNPNAPITSAPATTATSTTPTNTTEVNPVTPTEVMPSAPTSVATETPIVTPIYTSTNVTPNGVITETHYNDGSVKITNNTTGTEHVIPPTTNVAPTAPTSVITETPIVNQNPSTTVTTTPSDNTISSTTPSTNTTTATTTPSTVTGPVTPSTNPTDIGTITITAPKLPPETNTTPIVPIVPPTVNPPLTPPTQVTIPPSTKIPEVVVEPPVEPPKPPPEPPVEPPKPPVTTPEEPVVPIVPIVPPYTPPTPKAPTTYGTYTLGTPPDLHIPTGLNPGWIQPAPFYKNTTPSQAEFYWGNHPYQLGPVFNQELYNNVPNAPKVPWGISNAQTSATPEEILKTLAGYYPSISGPIMPTAKI